MPGQGCGAKGEDSDYTRTASVDLAYVLELKYHSGLRLRCRKLVVISDRRFYSRLTVGDLLDVSDYSMDTVMRRVTREHFLKTLIPMLLLDDHPEFDSLKSETWEILKAFTILNDDEQEFVNRLQQGELLPELLFPDSKRIQELMRTHPPLLWKVQNARKHFR